MSNERLFTINGETKNLKAWCNQYGMCPETVTCRLKRGMPILMALTKPVNMNLSRRKDKPQTAAPPKVEAKLQKPGDSTDRCKDCFYSELDGLTPVCMYAVKHVPPQRRPCPPGDSCTVYRRGVRKVNNMVLAEPEK